METELIQIRKNRFFKTEADQFFKHHEHFPFFSTCIVERFLFEGSNFFPKIHMCTSGMTFKLPRFVCLYRDFKTLNYFSLQQTIFGKFTIQFLVNTQYFVITFSSLNFQLLSLGIFKEHFSVE